MLLLQLTSLVIFKGREILHFDLVYLNIYFVLCFVKRVMFLYTNVLQLKGMGLLKTKHIKVFVG